MTNTISQSPINGQTLLFNQCDGIQRAEKTNSKFDHNDCFFNLRKLFTLFILTLSVLSTNAYTYQLSGASGNIYVTGSDYSNNRDDVWYINCYNSQVITFNFNISLENYYDYVQIYSIDDYGNESPYPIASLTGNIPSGMVYTDIPSGRAKVVFHSDGSGCYDSGYMGFMISYSSYSILPLEGGSINIAATTVTTDMSPGTFSSTPASGGNVGYYSYYWQQSPDGSNWSTCPGNAGDENYTVPELSSTTYFQRAVFSNTSYAVSNTVCVTVVEPSPAILPADKTYKKTDGTFTSDPSQGVMVGSISGSASVTPTGGATYQIPIEVPDGINGMKPQVSIVYSSQSGLGALGTGWDISAASSITRGAKNSYFDVYNANVKLDDYDALYLDGQRLIKLSSGGNSFTPGTVYATEVENFARVTVTSNPLGGVYFVVVTKDGKTMEYGRNTDAQLRNSSNTTIMTWKLNKVTDLYNNYMTYSYENGQYLQRIDYTGNGSITPAKSVIFTYTTYLPYPRVSYIKSFKMTQNRILTSICTYSGSTKISDYRFDYVNSGVDKHLDNITRYASDNSRLKYTKINWGAESSLQQVEVGDVTDVALSQQKPGEASIIYADMNNDGYPDRIEMWVGNSNNPGHIYVYLFDKTTNKFRNYSPASVTFTYQDYQKYQPKMIASDIDNDGQNELMLCNGGLLHVCRYNIAANTLSINQGANTKHVLGEDEYNVSNTYELITLDINSDNYNDVVFVFKGYSESGVVQRLPTTLTYFGSSNGLTSNSYVLYTGYESLYSTQIGDFNADGTIDAMGLTSNSGSNEIPAGGQITYIISGLWGQHFSNYTNLITGDFNGDGLSDILGQSSSTHYWSILSNNEGVNYSPVILNFSNVIHNSSRVYPEERSQMCPIDYNGDGLPDLILGDETFLGKIFINTVWYFYRNTGGSFVLDQTITSYDRMPQLNAGVTDINNDGVADLVIPVGNKFKAFTMPNANRRNLVTGITDGMGLSDAFVYKNYDNYSQETTTYPLRNLNVPITVVEKHTDVTGSETQYNYQRAKVHVEGKGFLGFNTVTVSNQQKNIKSVANYEINPVYYGVSLKNQTTTNFNGDISISAASQTNDIKVVDASLKRYMPVVTAQVSTDVLKNLTQSSSTIYDDYGNVSYQEVVAGDDNDKVTTKISTTYKSTGTGIARYLPESVTVTKQKAGEQDYIRTTSYEYDGNRSLIKEIKDPTDPNKLTTEYKNFDVWGRARSVEISITGKPVRSSSVEYTTSGYFIKSKTNPLGQKTSYNWDESKGLLFDETEELPLGNRTTSHAYDAWGREVLTTYPDGVQKGTTIQWANGTVSGAQYYTYSQTSGSSPVWVWYDAKGRELRKDYYGVGGKKICVSTTYYVTNTANNGLISAVTQPYFMTDGESSSAVTTYTYDDFGRPLTVTTPMSTTTTSYNYRTTTVSNPEQTAVSILNSAGQTKTSTVNGKSVNYSYYASGLTKSSTPDGGQPITTVYDLQGNRIKLYDPDGGFVRSEYNGFGELTKEVQRVHLSGDSISTTNVYEADGKLDYINRNNEITDYTYDVNKRVSTIEIAGKHKQTFTYEATNKIDLVTNIREEINGRVYNTGKQYDSYGRVYRETYPSGYYVTNTYDSYSGSLTEVKDMNNRLVFRINTENARGQLTSINKGTKETVYGFDSRGLPTSIVASGVENMSYSFDSKGNLTYRIDNQTSQREDFTYDALNRLTNWDITRNGQITYNSMNFDDNGNTTGKSDLGSFTLGYGGKNPNGGTTGRTDGSAIGPHALSTISGVPGSYPSADLNVTYTDFKKIKTLTEGNKYYELGYGVDDQRRKSVYKVNNVTQLTRYYVDDYEEEINATTGNIRKIHYLSGAIYIDNSNYNDSLYYVYTDYQGSVIALTDEGGTVKRRFAYDPWGKRRDATNWTLADNGTNLIINRGYTGHEHLDAFGIINMNGRVYDPYTATFFSPDPYVQAPGDWLNYNSYGYCMGNPFRYTDPSGYNWISDAWNWISGSGLKFMTNMVTDWYYKSDSGYEFQKMFFKKAYHYIEGEGSDVYWSGWEVSTGDPTLFNWRAHRTHTATIVTNKYYDNSFVGISTITGTEDSFVFGLINYYYNDIKSGDISQTSNMLTVGIPFFNVKFEDNSIPMPKIFGDLPEAPGGDDYRSSALEINIGLLNYGYKIMDGEQTTGMHDGPLGNKVYKNETNLHRVGIEYIGLGPLKFGINSEKYVRAPIQNGWHWLRGIKKYWDVDENHKGKFYWYWGSTGGASLWY